MTDNVQQLKKDVLNTKKFSHAKIKKFMDRLYHLKEENLENDKKYRVLSHLQDFLEYEDRVLNNFKTTILSIISTVFLPLGFITGFFGMNFRSMGNQGIRGGILSINNPELVITGFGIVFFILILWIFHTEFHWETTY